MRLRLLFISAVACLSAGLAWAQQTTVIGGIVPVTQGGTNCSTASITCFNNITGYTASGATGTTSTNVVFSTSPTFAGTVTGPDSGTWGSKGLNNILSLNIEGNISASAWTTAGIALIVDSGSNTYTDTSSSGTVGEVAINGISGAQTLAASSATTYTYGETLRIGGCPSAGTNVTITNCLSLETAGTARFASALLLPGLASSSSATTGTLCWTTSTGNITVDTTTTCLLSLEELKDIRGAIGRDEALRDVMALKPFWGAWKKDTPEYAGDKAEQPFLGAHQVAHVDKRLAAYDPKGNLHGVRYQEMVAVLVAAMQQQQHEIAELRAEVKVLRVHRRIHGP